MSFLNAIIMSYCFIYGVFAILLMFRRPKEYFQATGLLILKYGAVILVVLMVAFLWLLWNK